MHRRGPTVVEDEADIVLVRDKRTCIANVFYDTQSQKDSAKLLSAAYNSYDHNCGPNAVEAAEGDLLGKALEACDVAAARLGCAASYFLFRLGDKEMAIDLDRAVKMLRAVLAQAGQNAEE